jgi:DNA polymerase-3 subunit delta
MTPDEVMAECAAGHVRPVYLVVGEERLLADRAIAAIRKAAMAGGIAGFNEERFTAGESSFDDVAAAAKMLPMMSPRRWVLVRSAERWEKDAERAEEKVAAPKKLEDAPPTRSKKAVKDTPLDALDAYAKDPSPTTTLVVVATKLNGARRIVKTAKSGGFLVECQPIKRRDELTQWVNGAARSRGHAIDGRAAARVAELAGPDLGSVDDAIERLSLYVGPGANITGEAVDAVVARVRESSVWDLIDALVARKLDAALVALPDVMEGPGSGLPALGAIASNVRQLLKMDAAMRAGQNPMEAAATAGVPPFKAQDRAALLRKMPARTLASWPRLLARADIDLKGSKKDGQSILEETIIAMCDP